MRSSALAEEVIARNIEAVFIGDIQELPWVTSRIEELGFSQILNKEDDFVPNSNSDVLILDSYSIPIDIYNQQVRLFSYTK
jgi:spore coat polysaccharide biosynthesis predicted glycosyltransferase SpsG